MKWYPFILLLFLRLSTIAQSIGGIALRWEGDPSEWVIYADSLKEEETGTIRKRWERRVDVWDYSIGKNSGAISMKWKSKPDIWQIRSDSVTLIAKTIWPGDFSSWIIEDGEITIRYKLRYDPEDWETEDSENYGYYAIWTDREGDPGSWTIYDELFPEILHVETKVLLSFLPLWLNVYGDAIKN